MKYEFNKEKHLHTLDGKPLTGTSSVGNVLAKNLAWWAAELSAVECLESGGKIPTIREEYELAAKSSDKKKAIDELQKKYPIFKKARFAHFNKKNETAKEGTDLHAELERFIKSKMGKNKENGFDERIKPFIEWSDKNVKRFLASEAHCYSERLWVGGIVDAVAELNDGNYVVIDFKSAKEAYPTHFVQTCLYAIQIEENGLFSENGKSNKKLDNKFNALMVVPFGANKVEPQIRYDIDEYKKGAESAVVLYRLLGLEGQN
jgi:hypothetical protein